MDEPRMPSAPLYERTLVVPFSDTDASGRVHFSSFFRWFEATEHEFLGAIAEVDATAFPRVRAGAEYIRPTRFGDRLIVRIESAKLGTTSIHYSWTVLNESDGAQCARGEIIAVHVDRDDRPIELPPALRQRVNLWRRAEATEGNGL
jgi:acyl-CoA thioester hydrolase